MFPTVPAGLDDFVELVVPELQRRGIFRTAYTGTTLREHLGLPGPEKKFFPSDRGDRGQTADWAGASSAPPEHHT
jgi:hypothetical protein